MTIKPLPDTRHLCTTHALTQCLVMEKHKFAAMTPSVVNTCSRANKEVVGETSSFVQIFFSTLYYNKNNTLVRSVKFGKALDLSTIV